MKNYAFIPFEKFIGLLPSSIFIILLLCVSFRTYSQNCNDCIHYDEDRPQNTQPLPSGTQFVDMLGYPWMNGANCPSCFIMPISIGNGLYQCNRFRLAFRDQAIQNGVGFDDQTQVSLPSGHPLGTTSTTLGNLRRWTACQVFDYISSTISIPAGTTPDIIFDVSQTDGTGALAFASPFFTTSNSPAFTGGLLLQHILTGIDPTPSPNDYDATVTFDFAINNAWPSGGTSIPFNCDAFSTNGNGIDLYSVLLHEATHALGFISLVQSSGLSARTNSSPGIYSLFDRYTRNNSNQNIVNNTNFTFQGGIPQLTSNQLTYFEPGNSKPYSVYSPSTWQNGSSLGHFDQIRDNNTPYLMTSTYNGGLRREWTLAELEVLCDLGYALQTSSPLFLCNDRYAVGVDDNANGVNLITPVSVNVILNDYDLDPGQTVALDPTSVTLFTTGAGTVTVTGNTITLTPSGTYCGNVLIRYRPRTIQTNVNGSFATLTINIACPGFCLDDPCNLICNGSLEAGPNLAAFNAIAATNLYSTVGSGAIDRWSDGPTNGSNQINSTDAFFRGTNSNAGIPINFAATNAPGVETPTSPNNKYSGMTEGHVNGLIAEALVTQLISPLVAGQSYTLTYSARAICRTSNCNSVIPRLRTSFTINSPIWTMPPGQNPLNLQGTNLISTPITLTNSSAPTNNWTNVTINFLATQASNFFIIEPEIVPDINGGSKYFFVDNFRLVRSGNQITTNVTSSNPNPVPGQNVTFTIQVCNTGNSAVNNVSIQNVLPSGFTLVNSNFSAYPNHTFATIVAGACVTRTVTAQPTTNVQLNTDLQNCVSVTSANACNQTQGCAIVRVRPADIAVSTTAQSCNSFRVTITNLGTHTTNNVILSYGPPVCFGYTGFNVISGTASYASNQISIPILQSGQSVVIQFNGGSAIPLNCVNTVSYVSSSNTFDNNIANNSSAITLPIHTVQINGNTNVCVSSTLSANVSPAGVYTYQWRLNGVNISGATSSTYTATQSGSYTVVTTNTATGCIVISNVLNVTASNLTASLSTSTPTCAGSAVSIIASPSGSGFTYSWSANTDGVTNSGSAYGFLNGSTATTFSVTVTSQQGCTASATTQAIGSGVCCTPPSGSIVINNYNSTATTNLSAIPGFTGNSQNFVVWGTLILNQSIVLDNCDFYMGPNAKVILSPSVEIEMNECAMRACTDYMWDGIYASNSSNKLLILNNVFAESKNAFVINGDVSYNFASNVFYDNYIGMRIVNMQKPFTTAPINLNEIGNNMFSAKNLATNLKKPYNTKTTGFKGIDILNSGTSIYPVRVFGEIRNSPTIIQYHGNYYRYLDFGVYSQNSHFVVYGSDFKDIHRNPSVPLSGNAIYAEKAIAANAIYNSVVGGQYAFTPSRPFVQANNFENCHQGVSILGCNASVVKNTMANMTTGVRIAWATNGNIGTPNTINISDNNIGINNTQNSNNTTWPNQFFLYKYAINSVMNQRANITVSHNTITLPQAQSVTGQTLFGVKLEEFSQGSNGTILVNNTNHVEGGDIAFHTNNITGATFDGNEAINHPNGANYAGFWLDNSNINTLTCNNVDAVNQAYSTRGYRLNVSTGNSLNTNKVANAFRGIEASGICDMPLGLRANVLNNNFLGLVVRDNGRIRVQGMSFLGANLALGNRFTGNFRDLCSYNSQPSTNDRYYYNNITNPNLPSSNIALNTLGGTPIAISIQQANSFLLAPNPSCAPFNFMVAPPVSDNEMKMAERQEKLNGMVESVQNSSYENGMYAEVMKFVEDREIFEKIETDNALKNEATLNDFYEDKKDENLGKIVDIEKRLQKISEYDKPQATESEIMLEKLQKLQEISNDKNNFVYENGIEEKWKIVVEKYIKLLLSEERQLEDEDLDMIYNIAILCPYIHGTAVYQARFLLNAQDAGIWIDDETACQSSFKTDEGDPLKELANSKWDKTTENMLSLFPIPTKSNLSLIYEIGDNTDLKIEVVNVLGQLVLNQRSISSWGFDEVNTSLLANGLYTLKVYKGLDLKETRKFVVEK